MKPTPQEQASAAILAGLERGFAAIFKAPTAATWEEVDAIWADGRKCEGCKFHHRWTEGTGEKLHECGVRNEGGYKPDDCPGLE